MVLVAEDDDVVGALVQHRLGREGFQVVRARDGVAALAAARSTALGLIVLDIMLPGLSGLEVCRILRKQIDIPILMLTAKTDEVDKVVGLEVGADDYITKPFGIRELMARVLSALRRSEMQRAGNHATDDIPLPLVLKSGGLEVDPARHEVKVGGMPVKLSPREFRLLAFLMENRGQVFNRDKLVEKVWGYEYEGGARTVDVHIRSLRQRIEDDPAEPRHLLTVHGFGYKFEE